MDIKKRSYEITSGPSKDRIFDSCKYLVHGYTSVNVAFEVMGTVRLVVCGVQILGIEHDENDSGGDSFNLKGVARLGREDEALRFTAYYNAKSRKGSITFYFN